MIDFIQEDKIHSIFREYSNPSDNEIKSTIQNAKKLNGLSLEETAILLQTKNPKLINQIFSTAKEIKEKIYGSRLVLFAPLYLSNHCANNCLYCGFRKDNLELKRKTLTLEEIEKEVNSLLKEGHKRLLLVAGEHPTQTNIDYLEKAIETVYSVKKEKGEIRRVNINTAPLSLEEFKRLKSCGIGTYQLFQETYHPETYKKMHPSGPKSNYSKRLEAIELALKAGIDDLGIGALFGLYDYKFEALALLSHTQYLDKEYGIGPHTISIPRIESALNAPIANSPPYPVSDFDFKKLVAILRLAVPYTGLILSTRESSKLRNEVFSLGISQISAGSRTNPGAYSESKNNPADESQFELHDSRTLSEVVQDICKLGFLPSFCTACYRSGRTGDKFMKFAKSGEIQNFCLPNALLTFKEYLIDYGTLEVKEIGEKVIQKELENIPNQNIQNETKNKLNSLEKGKRDPYF